MVIIVEQVFDRLQKEIIRYVLKASRITDLVMYVHRWLKNTGLF